MTATDSGLRHEDIKCQAYLLRCSDEDEIFYSLGKLRNKLVIAHPDLLTIGGFIPASGYGPKGREEERMLSVRVIPRLLFPAQQTDAYVIPTEKDGYLLYKKVYVHTVYMDSCALVEHSDGNTEFVDIDMLVWNKPQKIACSCPTRTLISQGCQCGGN